MAETMGTDGGTQSGHGDSEDYLVECPFCLEDIPHRRRYCKECHIHFPRDWKEAKAAWHTPGGSW